MQAFNDSHPSKTPRCHTGWLRRGVAASLQGGDVERLPAALRQQMHGGGRLGLIIDIFFFAELKLRWCWMADEWRGTLTHWDIFFLHLLKAIKHSRKGSDSPARQIYIYILRYSLDSDLVFKVTRHLKGFINAFKGEKIRCLSGASFQLQCCSFFSYILGGKKPPCSD